MDKIETNAEFIGERWEIETTLNKIFVVQVYLSLQKVIGCSMLEFLGEEVYWAWWICRQNRLTRISRYGQCDTHMIKFIRIQRKNK